jgi:hypothetical protein
MLVVFSLLSAVAGCQERDPASVEWKVADDQPEQRQTERTGEAQNQDETTPYGRMVEGFFEVSQQLHGRSSSRAIWWDGQTFREFRNEQLIFRASCESEPIDENAQSLTCIVGEESPGISEFTRNIPLAALDETHIYHRGAPRVVYSRRDVPAYATSGEQDQAEGANQE